MPSQSEVMPRNRKLGRGNGGAASSIGRADRMEELTMASQQFEPPSGTRDFLAGDLRVREHVFATIREVFERYGFEPLQTPAFERLETLTASTAMKATN